MEPVGGGATEHTMMIAVTQGPEAGHITEPLVAIVEVAFRKDQWWAMPQHVSDMILQKMRAGEDAGYTYDWGEHGRNGSWQPEGQETKINRYVLDFGSMTQTNIDNNRKRSFRIAYVRPEDVQARFTGEIPDAA